MKKLLALLVLLLAACMPSPTEPPEGSTQTEVLHAHICIDSTWVHPAYPCVPTDTISVTIVIANPNG